MSAVQSSHLKRDGFTLVEVIVASAISSMILIGLISFFISTHSYWYGVNSRMDADSDVNIALSRMVYGMGDRLGLRTISKVKTFNESNAGWTLTYLTGGEDPPLPGNPPPQENSFVYSVEDRSLIFNPGDDEQIVGRDIAEAKLTVNGKTITSVKMITDAGMITVQLRVEKNNKREKLAASREIGTTIHFRNTPDGVEVNP